MRLFEPLGILRLFSTLSRGGMDRCHSKLSNNYNGSFIARWQKSLFVLCVRRFVLFSPTANSIQFLGAVAPFVKMSRLISFKTLAE